MKTSIKKILFCTDLSENGKNVFKYVVDMSEAFNAEIYILYVMEEVSNDQIIAMRAYSHDSDESFANIDEVKKRRMQFSKEEFVRCQKEFWQSVDDSKKELKNNIVKSVIIEGHPSDTILNYSKKIACDLLIMGSDKNGILGGVAKRVLRRSRIPALIVPTP